MNSPNPDSILTANYGMDNDSSVSTLKPGQLTFARNAIQQNFDGKRLSYQNEQSNVLCGQMPDGYRAIGVKNIIEQKRTIIFATNPQTGDSAICEQKHGECQISTILKAACLNFNIDYPIHKVIVKTSNCSTQLFWTDGLNPRRWIDLEDLPWKETIDPANPLKKIKNLGVVDCNLLLVQPNFSIPVITETNTTVGGDLTMGTYQFAVQYANAVGDGLTSFYGITNPLTIFQPRYTQDFNLKSDQAIVLQITSLDVSGLFDHFNLAVIKTINNITSVELAGTFPVGNGTYDLLYTGESKSDIRMTINDIFERFPYYDTAQDVTSSDNALVWADLSIHQKINYQQIFSKVKLYWESWKVPYSKFEAYRNPINTARIKGHFRDEVYAYEGCFLLKNGKITEKCHIPGRIATDQDRQTINNTDVIVFDQDPCSEQQPVQRWQLYNTATLVGHSPEYADGGADSCYIGPYQYGEFGYYESTETYPDNSHIWGDLAGKPIRHHRFPDCSVSPIHDNNPGGSLSFSHCIFPIGVKIDVASLYKAIDESDLTEEEKSQIAGFKIMRANRTNHKSIIAKGLMYNVGKYKYEGSTYFYPNYPFNDLNADPFIAGAKITAKTGSNSAQRLRGFSDQDSQQRFTFHSPDTHFYQPYGVDSGYVKLEGVSYGKSRSHYVPVKENAKYKFLTKDATRLAFAAGMASIVTLEVGGGAGMQAFQAQAGLQFDSVIPSFQSTLEVIKNITPPVNYGWQFNSLGNYCNLYPVPESGSKIRRIISGGYLTAGMQHLGDTYPINNIRRESSVYLRLGASLPFPHQVTSTIAQENSRYLLSEIGCDTAPGDIVERNICSYYAAIKRVAPGQYGRIHSCETVDTGFYQSIDDGTGLRPLKFTTVFGGDCFINRFALKRKLAYFLDETVNKADGTDINLDDLSNIGYPIFWYSTKPIDINADLSGLEDEINTLTDFSFWTVVSNLISGGTKPVRAGFTILNKLFNAYLQVLGVSNINLDCASTKNMNELGKAYLFNYGIPYFFVESEVNVDARQAIDDKAGNFFPNVSQDIPDDWLQEVNVPLSNDNNYTYNKTYSKQNKETSFSPLPENFDPEKTCLTHFSNRVIYSEKANMEESKNHWLVYRPISYADLSKNFGPICSIDGLEDNHLLVRFAHKSLLYNVMATLNTEAGIANLGNPAFFSQPPLDFKDSDQGFAGSNNKILLKTPYGHIWTDETRGQVLLLQGNNIDNLAEKGLSQWLQSNLPFYITRYFPAVKTDNHFADFGITGVFDARYNRLLLTKRDYEPLNSAITYSNGKFMLKGQEISPDDTSYFCNRSWTLSFSFLTGAWVSFHSYVPNFYIGHPRYFQSGIQKGIYNHNTAFTYGSFYGQPAEYILEYPLSFGGREAIVGSFSDYTTVLKYENPESYYEVDNDVYFNQAVIYSDSECSGTLNLISRPRGNLKAYMSYPRYNPNSKDILVTKSGGMFNFNQFWDIVKSRGQPFFSTSCNKPSLDKTFLDANLDYSTRVHNKSRIRSRDARVRLIYASQGPYKLISNFILTDSQNSYK